MVKIHMASKCNVHDLQLPATVMRYVAKNSVATSHVINKEFQPSCFYIFAVMPSKCLSSALPTDYGIVIHYSIKSTYNNYSYQIFPDPSLCCGVH